MSLATRNFLIAAVAFCLVGAVLARTLSSDIFAQSWPAHEQSTTSIALDARVLVTETSRELTGSTVVRIETVKPRSPGLLAEGVDVYGVSVRVNGPGGIAISRAQRVVSQIRSEGTAARSATNIKTIEELNSSGDEVQRDVSLTGISGQVLRFPKSTRRATYEVWDPETGRSWPAEYVGTAVVEGKRSYVFRQRVPSTVIGTVRSRSTASSPVSVKIDRTIWVRPEIGAIVRSKLHITKWIDDGNDQVMTFDATFEDKPEDVRRESAAVDQVIERAKWFADLLPLTLVAVGIMLALIAIVREGSGNRSSSRRRLESLRENC